MEPRSLATVLAVNELSFSLLFLQTVGSREGRVSNPAGFSRLASADR